MKIRSKQLYAYLFEAGVLNGTPEEIDRAKFLYRKLYKRQWKQRQQTGKEIRITVTQTQFERIKLKAQEYQLPHTTYCRNVILSAVNGTPIVAGKDDLLKVLQKVSMAAIALEKNAMQLCEVSSLLFQAEIMLIEYLNY